MSQKVILCVDDEKIILDSLRSQLVRNLGNQYLYEFAESASEAFEVLQSLRDDGIEVHAIISDWLMPGMKGDKFLAQVHTLNPDITKILLTGHIDSSVIRNLECCNTIGINCIYKPWSEEQLIRLLHPEVKV